MSYEFITLSEDIPSATDRVTQGTLFPVPIEQVLAEYGLRLLDVQRLYHAELLGFEPHAGQRLHPPQEQALRFLGSLFAAGCDVPMIESLLDSLEPGYAHEELLYDFLGQRWLKPEPVSQGEVFDTALGDLSRLSTAQLARLSTESVALLAKRAQSAEKEGEE